MSIKMKESQMLDKINQLELELEKFKSGEITIDK
jgi:hypothetical protein